MAVEVEADRQNTGAPELLIRQAYRIRIGPGFCGATLRRLLEVLSQGWIPIMLGIGAASNLADYIVSTNADAPNIDVNFLDYPDTYLDAYGARGIGEIGLPGVCSRYCLGVYHATGVRVRELPIRIEDLLVQP